MSADAEARIRRAFSKKPAEDLERLLTRAKCEIDFARAFAEALPESETGGWSEAIERAQSILDAYDPASGRAKLQQAIEQMEADLVAVGEKAKGYTVHCVGHGHIDMNWMWSWPETVSTTHDTFAAMLSLMEQYPDYTYSQSQASVYALIEKYHPAMFEQIQQRVKEGRWEVTAVHWVEGDKNLASGESLARHILYTRRYFQEKFGLGPDDIQVDWEPDTFGHANTIPGILRQGGVKYYYSCRPGGGFGHARIGGPRPRLFWWQSPDGSKVLVNRESTWYNSYVNIGANVALPLCGFVKETALHDWLNVYGVGNHGGGPTRDEIDYYIEMRDWPIYPNVVFGTAQGWFRKVEAEVAERKIHLPTLAHELNFEFTGCYTSQSAIKRANRFGENFLEEAESLAAINARISKGYEYPRAMLRDAWLNVLFNHFHDILPGSGVADTRQHALGLFQEVGAITGSIKRNCGVSIASRVDTLALLPETPEAKEERELAKKDKANTPFIAGAGIGAGKTGYSQASGGGRRFRPVVIYNPCAWMRSEPVTVALYDTDLDPNRIVAIDEQGASHPTFLVAKGHDWGHDKMTVIFNAVDVPGLGYRTFVLCEGTPNAKDPGVRHVDGMFETPTLKLQFDKNHGALTELWDKRSGARLSEMQEAFAPEKLFGHWEFVLEKPRGMTAWALGEEVDRPIPLRAKSFRIQGLRHNEATDQAYDGEMPGFLVEAALEVPGTDSTVKLTAYVHGLAPRVDVTAEIDWREIGDQERGIPGLCVRFPLGLATDTVQARYETPYGSVDRSALRNGEEVPSLRYAHIASIASSEHQAELEPFGFTLLQDSKYGHSLTGDDVRLRIVRSSFDPDHAPEVGKQTVRYAVHLHERPAELAELTRLGAAWNHPFIVFPANLQTGDAPPTRSFARVRNQNVVLTALKLAEDSDGLIIRLAELQGAERETEAEVELDAELIKGYSAATVVDLMEQPTEGKATLLGETLRVAVKANSFVTVLLS